MAQQLRRALTALALALGCLHAWAAPAGRPASASDWAALSPARKEVLNPLAATWGDLSADRRLKWIGIADRFPKMTPQEQIKVRERMRDWVDLSPQERAKARDQYKKLRTAPPAERARLEEKWREYEALPDEEKQALKAKPKQPRGPAARVADKPPAPRKTAPSRPPGK